MADLSAILARPVPAKPATFAPELAPDGVEVKFVTFVLDRPIIAPRSILTHTNAASREGSVESAWNWSHAAPNTNTVPTYQVDRRHDGVWARKMLPSNRRAIANATVTSSHSDWDSLDAAERADITAHGQIRDWSLAIETADLGFPTPGEDEGFELDQADLVATCIAYESVVHGFPLDPLTAWHGAGVATHTEPFGYPFTTTARGKTCPGRTKKQEFWAFVLPRARQIKAAWLAPPPPPPDPDPVPVPVPIGELMFITRTDDRPSRVLIGDRLHRRLLEDDTDAKKVIADSVRAGVPLVDLVTGKPVDALADVSKSGRSTVDRLGKAV
jgi:hypothetical protein